MSGEPLACPSCALRHPLEERFCFNCGMPLTHVGADPSDEPESEAHARARKIDPQFTEGELLRVAGGRHQAEAELIQGMLLEEGVPSMLRRSPGFDVPDFLAAGPRDVFVPESGVAAARQVLLEAEMAPQIAPAGEAPRGGPAGHAARLLGAVLGGGALAALVAWMAIQLAG